MWDSSSKTDLVDLGIIVYNLIENLQSNGTRGNRTMVHVENRLSFNSPSRIALGSWVRVTHFLHKCLRFLFQPVTLFSRLFSLFYKNMITSRTSSSSKPYAIYVPKCCCKMLQNEAFCRFVSHMVFQILSVL